MAKHNVATRKIELRYREDQLGKEAIEKICRLYNSDIEISSIAVMINGPRVSGFTVNLADIYAVLNHAAQKKLVKQRKRHLAFELTLSQFFHVYKAWKAGYSIAKLQRECKGSKVGIDRVARSMNLRVRTQSNGLEIAAEAEAYQILKLAKPLVIAGRRAFVIFEDELPEGSLENATVGESIARASGRVVEDGDPATDTTPAECSNRKDDDSISSGKPVGSYLDDDRSSGTSPGDIARYGVTDDGQTEREADFSQGYEPRVDFDIRHRPGSQEAVAVHLDIGTPEQESEFTDRLEAEIFKKDIERATGTDTDSDTDTEEDQEDSPLTAQEQEEVNSEDSEPKKSVSEKMDELFQ